MGAPGSPRRAKVRARPAPGGGDGLTLILTGAIDRADIPALCRETSVLLRSLRTKLVVCDLEGVARPDAVTVDALCRLQLAARTAGGRLQVGRAPAELADLIRLMGLGEVLPSCEGSALESRRQPE